MTRPVHEKKIINIIISEAGHNTPLRIDDLIVKTGLTHKQVLRVMDRLARLGYIKTVKTEIPPRKYKESGLLRRYPTWKLNADKLISRRAVESRKKNTGRDKIWRAIRIKRKFTLTELEQFTQLNRASLQDYVCILESGKYLKRQPNTGKILVFVLVNDPGPDRPVLELIE